MIIRQTQIEEISTIKGEVNILDLLNFFKDITLIITPIVSVLLLVKYISELRKLTLEHQKVKLEYEKLKNEFEKRKQIVVNATAEDIARYVVNPIVREIDKAERERLEMQVSFLRENLSKEMESQSSFTKDQIERQQHNVERICESNLKFAQEQRHLMERFFDWIDSNVLKDLKIAIELVQKYTEQEMSKGKEKTNNSKLANQANAADAKSGAAD